MIKPDLELRILGSPALSRGGEVLQLHSRRTMALLAYLALESDQDHPRAQLAAFLWHGTDSPRHSLRQALYSLRNALGALGDECLIADRQFVRLQPNDRLRVDSRVLRRAAEATQPELANLAEAASLYQGPLLLGFDLPDQEDFELWLAGQRTSCRHDYLRVLSGLAEGYLRLHQLDEAETWARRLLDEDPLLENAHRLMMRVHAGKGDTAELEAQFRRCKEVIEEELNSELSDHTRSLYEQLTGAARSAGTVAANAPPAHATLEWLDRLPLVGRQQEMEILSQQLSDVREGKTQLAWIEAESGMGKSRLLQEFIRTASTLEDPPHILRASCHEHEFAAPYTLWADALRPLSEPSWQPLWRSLPEVWRQELSRLLPELGKRGSPLVGLSPEEGRLRLHQATARTLHQLSQRSPLVLALDDLHWIDEASLALLHYIVRHADPARVLIVGTHRPEASRENLAWERFITDPSRSGSRLTLEPLTPKSIRALLDQLPASYDDNLPQVLQDHSDGVPLVLLENLRAMMTSGHMVPEGGKFRIEVPGETLPIPTAVHELVEHRISTLSDDARRALQCAAAIGRPFGVRLLADVTGLAEPLLLDICSDLERRGLFKSKHRERPDRPLGFAHSYIRRALYEELSTARRQTLHLRVAEALSQRAPVPASDLEEIAVHYERAKDSRALYKLLEAGRRALDLYAFEHSARLSQRGLDLATEISHEDPDIQYELLTLLETTLDRSGRRQEQRTTIERLLEWSEKHGSPNQRAEALLREASLLTYLGQHPDARAAGREAVKLLRRIKDRPGEAQALRELAFDHWGAKDFTTALDYAREVLEIHRSLNQVSGQASALHNLAEIHRELGSPGRALDLFQQAVELHWSSQDLEGQGLAYYGMGHAHRSLGELKEAAEAYQNALSALRKAGNQLMTSRAHHTLAALHQRQGQLETAHKEAQRALEISRKIGYGPGIAHGLTALARLHLSKDQYKLAIESLTEAVEWLEMLEDQQATLQAKALLEKLERGEPADNLAWPEPGWVRSHVPLEEGKVYCAFESPLARAALS